MPKHRLIATLLVDRGQVVQTRHFKRTNVVGSAFTAVDFFNSWTVDEILVLEISNDLSYLSRMQEIVSELSRRCFVPLSVGGKIRDLELARRYIRLGADKVVLNTGAVEQHALIGEIAGAFGRQCIVVSIDARPDREMPSGYRVVIDNARRDTDLDALDWARLAVDRGAGELMINSTLHDGNKQGYDLQLTKKITAAVSVPVIAMGGVGKLSDFVDGVTIGGADAVAAGNILHYFEHSTKKAQEAMAEAGLSVRHIGFYRVNMPRRPKYRPF
jgi:imidazole glycerol-phosphate synthase subunit HisF